MTSDAQRRRGKTSASSKPSASARQPITQHPLFPAIVALWFGALFGLGSLAIRASLIESLVLKTRLDMVFPAASPPLGMTARILLSLGLAAIGAAIGAMLGRMIGRPKKVVTERTRKVGDTVSARRGAKIVELDDFEDEDEGETVGFAAPRRRALTVSEDDDDKYHREFAPLPGGAPQILDVTEFDFTGDAPMLADTVLAETKADVRVAPLHHDLEPGQEPEPAALDLSGFINSAETVRQVFNAAPNQAAVPNFAPPAQAPHPAPEMTPVAKFESEALSPKDDAPTSAEQVFAPESVFTPSVTAEIKPEASGAAPAATSSHAVEGTHIDLVKRLAETMRQRREAAAALASKAVSSGNGTDWAAQIAAETLVAADPQPDAAIFSASASPDAPAFAEPVANQAAPAPQPTALSRFGPPEPATQPEDTANAGIDDDGSDIVVPSLTLPAALRPLSFEDSIDDDDETLSAVLPPRHITFSPPEPEAGLQKEATAGDDEVEAPAEVADNATEPALEDGYSSLLDLSRPASLRQTYVRIDEGEPESDAIEPTVQFPGTSGFAQRPVTSMSSFSIDEPSAELAAEPEPAPAATFNSPAGPFTPPAPVGVTPGNMRRFDAPVGGVHGGMPTSVNSNTLDAEETERALRTALATLQRMSARG